MTEWSFEVIVPKGKKVDYAVDLARQTGLKVFMDRVFQIHRIDKTIADERVAYLVGDFPDQESARRKWDELVGLGAGWTSSAKICGGTLVWACWER